MRSQNQNSYGDEQKWFAQVSGTGSIYLDISRDNGCYFPILG